MSLNTYVNSLIENVNSNNIPKNIDLVLDSGAFNGIYMLGGLIYLRQMRNKNKININRISGSSIGSILGLLFIVDKLDLSIEICNKAFKILRKNQDLKKFKILLEDILDKHITESDLNKINNKLYITYFDLTKGKQILKKKYKNLQELKYSLLKSMHVPYLFDRNITDNEGCVDGSFPHIFKIKSNKSRKILFINLQSIDKIINMIYIKNEKNLYPRLFNGLLEMHNFFSDGKNTNMYSYVNDWSIRDIFLFRLREIVYTLIIYIFSLGLHIDYFIPNKWKQEKIVHKYINIFKNLWRDIIIYLTI
ncbi:patatin-like phospholipase family protein [Candidatus Poseidonia alphae]|nr:patatin-like phospholipase family protein [Candidatus Poseidonia alphae]